MNKKTIQLSILTSVLFILSLMVYLNEHKRNSTLAAGSELVKGLDVEKVSKIIIKDQNQNELILKREGGEFVLENYHSFPANSLKVNDFLFQVANLEIKEKVAAEPESFENFEVSEKKAKLHVSFFDRQGNRTLDFFVGKSEKGRGNYLRLGQQNDVYLGLHPLNLPSTKEQFIDKNLYAISQKDLEGLKVKVGPDHYTLLRSSENATGPEVKQGLGGVEGAGEAGKEEKFLIKLDDSVVEKEVQNKLDEEKVKAFVSSLENLSFVEYYPYLDSKVQGLSFSDSLELQFKDQKIYQIRLAEKDKKYFLTIKGSLPNLPNQVQIQPTDDQAKLQEVEGLILAQKKIQAFNQRLAPWIFEIDEYKYKKLAKGIKDFLKS